MLRFAIILTVVCLAGGCALPASAAENVAPVGNEIASLLERSRDAEGNDPKTADQAAREALTIARQHMRTGRLLDALLQASKTARLTAVYSEAESLASEGLNLAARLRNEGAGGEFFIARGLVRWNVGNLPAATADFLEAHRIAERLDRDDLRIGAEYGLGATYGRDEDHGEALLHLENALRLAEKTHDPRRAALLNARGNIYLSTRDYNRARADFEQALTLINDGKNERLVAYITLNLGDIANRLGDQPQAAKYLEDAMAISRRFDLQRVVADAHYLFARVERALNHLDVAQNHLDEGMGTATRLGNPDLLASYYEEYVLTREAQGDYQGALEYARKLAEATNEIRGARSHQQMAELQGRYEAEARERQIKLLQRDTELQQSALDLKNAELSRTAARSYAFGEIVILAAIAVATIIARQRSRARRMLAEVNAAKAEIEEKAARNSRLLDIATQDLSESEAMFRDAFAHSPLGLALVATDGKWLRVNQALCHILGYAEAELLQMNFQAITHPDDLVPDLELLLRVLRGELDTYTLEKRYLHRAGHVIWARLDVSLHRDAAGTPRHFISQVQDITERRRADEQLTQAKEEAETASAAKNEFLSRMSHELRTPLNAILGFGQLLELQDLGPSHNQGVSYILTAGRHLLSLINEVLDLSSIESGKFAFSNEPMVVSGLLNTTLEMMRPLATAAGVSISLDGCPAETMILADPRRLKQVLLNLISNGIKYNRPGGKIFVRCVEQSGRLRIELRDTGVGIAAADLARIFAPFARLPATQEVPGTGLGLSLSVALTEGMGGKLDVQSEPGIGSTFAVEFPCLDHGAVCLPMFDPIVAEALGLGKPTLPAAPCKVLYVEDDVMNLELIERLFALDRTLELRTATTGRRGLEVARAERPDVILLDLHLPDMDGAEVLRTLRDDPALAGTPVVVISADAMSAQIENMRGLGAQAYLTKPIDITELRRVIGEMVRGAAVS